MPSFKPRKPWSKVSLHRHLLNLLARPTTSLKFQAKRDGCVADVIVDDNFPPAYVKITVDANNNVNVARYVMHELLHVVMSELVLGKFDFTLEEVIILGFETYMWEFISSSKPRLRKWEKIIAAKLALNPSPVEPSLQALADRSVEQKAADKK